MLPDGSVLVTGGYDNENGAALTSAELYDPASASWSATGSLNSARGNHTATLLSNGLVLVAGGYPNHIAISSAELYDPASGSWTATGSLNTARWIHTATLLSDGKVLVAGGVDGAALSSAELYEAEGSSAIMLAIHAVQLTASPSRIVNLNDGVDEPLRLVANEALLRNQPTVTGGLVADGVTPLLIQLDPNPAPTQATTFTFNTVVSGGTVAMANNLSAYLLVLQQSGTPQFVSCNSVVLSSAHPSGFAYISGIKSEDVQIDPPNNQLSVVLTAQLDGTTVATTQFAIRKPPVALVHGIFSSNDAWYFDNMQMMPNDFLGVLLEKRPQDFVVPVEYGVERLNGVVTANGTMDNGYDEFEGLAPLLDQQLREKIEGENSPLRQQWAFTRYDIVGHSQGGVLTRMLCTSDNPGWPDPNSPFRPFRSVNNANRGRFRRVITIGSPQNGTTASYYLSRLLTTPIARVISDAIPNKLGILSQKFDPFGAQLREINVRHWHVDPAAKFNLIGTTIYGGNIPPAPFVLGVPNIYRAALLCFPAFPHLYSVGSIVLPDGSDGIVDRASQFAGTLPSGVAPGYTPILGADIAHANKDPAFWFGVGVSDQYRYNEQRSRISSNRFARWTGHKLHCL